MLNTYKKARCLLIGLFIFVSYHSYGQLRGIEVIYETNKEGEYEFYANNTSGDYKHVIVDFITIQGLSSSAQFPFQKSVRPGRARLFTLKPLGTSTPNFRYQVYNFDGVANPRIKEVEYVFPIMNGKPNRISKLTSNLENVVGYNSSGEHVPMFAVQADLGDTIRAARRGKVVKILDDEQDQSHGNLSYSASVNQLVVRHLDGTEAWYKVFKNKSVMVSLGDEVFPGDPLALVAGEEYSFGPHVRLMIQYLDVDMDRGNNSKDWAETRFVLPKFRTKNSGLVYLKAGSSYEGTINPVLISQEMTKREKKKFLKAQGLN